MRSTAEPAPPVREDRGPVCAGGGTAFRSALWTGYEGVLIPPARDLLRQFALRVHVPHHALREAMREVTRRRGLAPAADGGLPGGADEEWARAVEEELESAYGVVCELSGFRESWMELCRPQRHWIDCLTELRRQGVYLGLFTSTPAAQEPGWLRLITPALFDAVVAWPEGRTDGVPLSRAEQTGGHGPVDCLLFDALEHRRAAARSAGWRVLSYDAGVSEVERALADSCPAAD
ncbi:hypothetical protein [Streptomyces physcomitrii]|uniref:Uncharacterized protein n=1 Tax=Streptomyces physcomitrii TaxID=2724184 RepID=A0ABX1H0I7_9ACTN|nr:hypothetical protein [Streptomyces physcomitrii]NKI40576.1 hypothetical protein [Streptomyces physcomitrii]